MTLKTCVTKDNFVCSEFTKLDAKIQVEVHNSTIESLTPIMHPRFDSLVYWVCASNIDLFQQKKLHLWS